MIDYNGDIVARAHSLWDEFECGNLNAGIELLEIFVAVHANEECTGYPFHSKMEHIISVLVNAEHPAGAYYVALAHLYDIIDIQMNADDCIFTGMAMMAELLVRGNEYAINWLECRGI